MSKYLVITLCGPMHHYGALKGTLTANSSVYYKTEKNPTRSAVLGMIGAAMGIERGDHSFDGFLSSLDIKYHVLNKGSVMVDYQTVSPLGDRRFKTVDGKNAGEDNNTIIKEVEYLQDYAFEVYVGGEEDDLDKIYRAFLNPVYPNFLGKRSCFPTKPFVTEKNIITLEGREDVYDCP